MVVISKGVSVLIINENDMLLEVEKLKHDDRYVFFNLGIDFSLKVNKVYKQRKVELILNCSKSEMPNKYLWCIKKIVTDEKKIYILGLEGLSYDCINHMMAFFIKEEYRNHQILFVHVKNIKNPQQINKLDFSKINYLCQHRFIVEESI